MGSERLRPLVIDWDDLPTWLATLDDTHRSQLVHAVLAMETASGHHAIVETVREVLERDEPDRQAVAVVFDKRTKCTFGTFLQSTGTVLFADGTVDELRFDWIKETFNDLFGAVGDSFGVSVDLRTGSVEYNDFAGHLYPKLGYPMKYIKQGN